MWPRIALLRQALALPILNVGFSPADDPQWQRLSNVPDQLVTGELADDVLLGDRANLSRAVGEEIHDVVHLPFVVGREPHRQDELIDLEAEGHRLHVTV